MIGALRPLGLAFALLTRFPVPIGPTTESQRRRATVCFPLVGYVLGGVLALVATGLRGLPEPLLAVLLCAGLAWLTGGLHLDGVADVFDAMGGARGERERALDIMRDSRIGAHGASALVFVVLAKAAAMAVLLPPDDLRPWFLFAAVARAGAGALGVWLPPARADGLGHAFRPSSRWSTLGGVLLFGIVPAVLFAPDHLGALVAPLVGALALGSWAKRRLGGITGDVYGASIEISEVAFLAAWSWAVP